MSVTPEQREVSRLSDVLDKHGVPFIRTDWFRPEDGADVIPYATVDLRTLAHVLERGEDLGSECTELLLALERQVDRITHERDAARAMITAVRTGRRSPGSLPEGFAPTGTDTGIREPHTPVQARPMVVPEPSRPHGLWSELWEGVKDGLRRWDGD